MSTSNFKTQKYFDLYVSNMTCEMLDENGEPTSEYDFDEYLFEETQEFVDKLNEKLDLFQITLESGYYDGVQTIVNDIDSYYDLIDFMEYPNDYDGQCIYRYFGYNKHILMLKIKKEINYINNILLPQLKDYCFDKYGSYAQFSNGETWYVKE